MCPVIGGPQKGDDDAIAAQIRYYDLRASDYLNPTAPSDRRARGTLEPTLARGRRASGLACRARGAQNAFDLDQQRPENRNLIASELMSAPPYADPDVTAIP